jgi:DNA mismatch endonuclease (patch repair protein)
VCEPAGYWGSKINRNVARDRKNEQEWKRLGWEVLVLWEWQVKEGGPLKQAIVAFLPKRF